MDELLAQLQAEFAQKQQAMSSPASTSQESELDARLAQLKAKVQPPSQPLRSTMPEDKSAGEIDNLLAEFKSEFQGQTAPKAEQSSGMDAMLAEIKSEFTPRSPAADTDARLAQLKAQQQQQSASLPRQGAIDDLLSNMKSEFSNRKAPATPPRAADHRMDKLLGELKSEFKQQDLDLQIEREQTQRQEQFLAQKQRQRRREALRTKAEKWLKGLDPYSDEGFWFEQFASSYESRLEAAIDYLEALAGS